MISIYKAENGYSSIRLSPATVQLSYFSLSAKLNIHFLRFFSSENQYRRMKKICQVIKSESIQHMLDYIKQIIYIINRK